jgi:hypothetical protein
VQSPVHATTEGRSGVGGSSDGQDEQSRFVLPPETGSLYSIITNNPSPSSSSSSSSSGFSLFCSWGKRKPKQRTKFLPLP